MPARATARAGIDQDSARAGPCADDGVGLRHRGGAPEAGARDGRKPDTGPALRDTYLQRTDPRQWLAAAP